MTSRVQNALNDMCVCFVYCYKCLLTTGSKSCDYNMEWLLCEIVDHRKGTWADVMVCASGKDVFKVDNRSSTLRNFTWDLHCSFQEQTLGLTL